MIAIVLLSACSVNHGTFTVISKNVVDLDNIDLSTQEKIDNVSGVSRSHIVIFFPFGEMVPNVESAMNDLLEKLTVIYLQMQLLNHTSSTYHTYMDKVL